MGQLEILGSQIRVLYPFMGYFMGGFISTLMGLLMGPFMGLFMGLFTGPLMGPLIMGLFMGPFMGIRISKWAIKHASFYPDIAVHYLTNHMKMMR